jgi:phosphatidylglycerol---prolipoprotein diacylglyceryl transferase
MHPVLFQINNFTIYTFWLFFSLGFLVFIYSLIKLSTRNGLKIQFLSEHSWKIIIWTLIGARIVGIFANFQTYFNQFSTGKFFELFYIWDKGLNIYGAIIAFLLCTYYFCQKNDQDFWKWMDTIIPSLIIGLAFGHIGAFFEGTEYGKETSLPWGVNFESPAIKYTVPIHPTQIYALLYSIITAITLIMLGKTEKIANLKPGFIGILGILIYTSMQFVEQFFRGDDTFTIFNIRIEQIILPLIIILSGIFLYLRYNKRTKILQ